MEDLMAVSSAINTLEQVHGEIATIATRDDDRRRQDLVDLRRKLTASIADFGRVAEPFFERIDDPELRRQYHSKFSAMRSAAALHQADWPAVRLGERSDEYRASALAVREANRAFVAWVRAALAGLRR
ncbi:MAG TPA: hypothetical protein VFT56_10030 [Sphingomonas sp.]|nr:hypothetical protein [Sphingomonas sp.]